MDPGIETQSSFNGNEDLQEINTEMLRKSLNISNNEKIAQKVIKQHEIIFSQAEITVTDNIQEEQTKIISQLVTRNGELSQLAENEANMRVNLYLNVENIKKKIINFKNYYNIIKQTIEQNAETKNVIEKLSQNVYDKFNQHIAETNINLRELQIKNGKLTKQLKNEQQKHLEYLKKAANIYSTKRKEIGKLKMNNLHLQNMLKGGKQKYQNTLQEIDTLVKEKQTLITELQNNEQINEQQNVAHMKEIQILNEQIHSLEQLRVLDTQNITEIEAKYNDLEQALEGQKALEKENEVKIQTLESTLQSSTEENLSLNKQFKELEEKFSHEVEMMKCKIMESENNEVILETSLSQLKTDYANLSQKYESSEEQVKLLLETNEENKQNEKNLQEYVLRLQSEYENKQASLQNLLKNLQDEMEDMKIEHDNAEKEFLSLQEKLQDRYDNIFVEKENLKYDIEKLKETKEEMRKDYSDKLQEITEESENKMHKLHEESEKMMKKLKLENETLCETTKKLELELNEEKTRKMCLKNELDQKIKEIEKLVAKKEQSEEHITEQSELLTNASKGNADQLFDIPSKDQTAKTMMNKMKIPKKFDFFDDSSDSSIEYPIKRLKLTKKLTQDNNEKYQDNNAIFDALREKHLFKHPTQETKKRHSRKTMF